MTFPEQLACHRQRLGLNQRGLAQALGISKRTLEHWMNPESKHKPHILTQLGAIITLERWETPKPLKPSKPERKKKA